MMLTTLVYGTKSQLKSRCNCCYHQFGLKSLVDWGNDNLTTFEQAAFIVVSRKKNPFNPFERFAGIIMDGVQVERANEAKLAGSVFNEKLTFGTMIDKLARKARLSITIAALRRLKPADVGQLESCCEIDLGIRQHCVHGSCTITPRQVR